MNKLILYGILLLVYLGLSKSLSPSEYGIQYINKKEDLNELIPGQPVSAILADIHSTGFLIKTYYQKLKIVYGFQTYEELIVRTSGKLSEELKPFIGMSIFRRYADTEEVSYTPLPPGSIFIGDKNYGNWKVTKSGNKTWRFFRVYRQLPNYLGWEDFVPSYAVYLKIHSHEELKKPYYGSNDEFGINGPITRKSYPRYFERQIPDNINLKNFIKDYLKENFIKRESL